MGMAPGRRRPWRARALAACLACASRAGRALHLEAPAAPALGTARLRPDGAYALAPDEPIEFTFEPQAEARGVGLQGLRLLVWDEAGGVAFDSGEVATGEPRALALLEPGAYTWGVRWRASSGEVAPLATSGLRVAVRDGDWRGVPWLGCPGYDRFAAEADGLRGRVSVLVAIPSFGYVTVNGRPLSQDLLSPSGWTNTGKRVLFRTYDATELLNSTGGARIAVHLGGGYREDPRHLLPDHRNDANRAARASHDEAPLVLRLQLRSSDGIRLHSGSPGWVKSRADPDANNSLYSGESTGTRGPVWEPVDEAQDVGGGPSGRMVAAAFPAVRATRVDSPVRIWREGRVQVVDFGSNVAGVCRVSVPAGTPGLPATLHMRHGEVLQHAGTPRARWERGGPNPRRVYFTNLRDAQARDRIHVPAEGVAGAFPRFTYHGFRYVEAYGFPADLSEVTFERLVVGTAVETKTEASFTDEVLQAIHRGAVGSQRSHLTGRVVTDCPQRDERLGWLGDAGLSAQPMMQHFWKEWPPPSWTLSRTSSARTARCRTWCLSSGRERGPRTPRGARRSWSCCGCSTRTQTRTCSCPESSRSWRLLFAFLLPRQARVGTKNRTGVCWRCSTSRRPPCKETPGGKPAPGKGSGSLGVGIVRTSHVRGPFKGERSTRRLSHHAGTGVLLGSALFLAPLTPTHPW
ncbi:unnamed protein product [Prorocentrum cordatum]|uniref:Beta-galactosidase n=1 Tax=Prorocentrum cordatum TaxID=2364126 RepID=A0ABN9W9A1_9DINO|nr:unnamed protein product [Polarella glacialis]